MKLEARNNQSGRGAADSPSCPGGPRSIAAPSPGGRRDECASRSLSLFFSGPENAARGGTEVEGGLQTEALVGIPQFASSLGRPSPVQEKGIRS